MAPRYAGIDGIGVLESRYLPDHEFEEKWRSIIVDSAIKTKLLCQGLLNFTLRPQVSGASIPLHGIILLVGPPGTGKTTLAKGLASRVAASVNASDRFRFIEAEPHALAGAALGKSQKAVRDFLGGTVAEAAALGPLIVLLDEVETLAADRQQLSLEANPIDVHRASDAVLAQLDYLASRHPNVLFIATSNFPKAIDAAFLSRADLVIDVGLPSESACQDILLDTLKSLVDSFPGIQSVLASQDIMNAGKLCLGLDGRQIRKAVISALTFEKETALDPNQLTAQYVLDALSEAKKQQEQQ